MTVLSGKGEAAPSVRPFPRLSRLIHPVDTATFERDYWQRQPLIVHRDDPDYFAGLLTLDDVDRVLSLTGVRLPDIRVVVDGAETPVSTLASIGGRNGIINVLETLYARYRSGSTIVLNGLDQRWEPLQRLSRELGAELSSRLQMNIYLTPAGSRGFASHYDTHDVFVAQVHGTKRWAVSGAPCELPLHFQPYDKSQPEPEADQVFDLRAGDVAYLPRGTVHSAASNDSASVHVTIGMHPVLYAQVLDDAIKKLYTEDVRFRRALPMGFASDEHRQRQAADVFAELAGLLAAGLPASDLTARSVSRATSMHSPALRGHLTDLEKLPRLWTGTHVQRRPDQHWKITVTDGTVSLEFHNKAVRLPADVADEVRYVAESNGEGFTAADIPGDLDEPGRLLLVQTLVREGFLTVRLQLAIRMP